MDQSPKIMKSEELSSGMATRLGIDLTQAYSNTSDIGVLALQGVVRRCAGCTEHETCAKLQAENDTLEQAPSYCRNKALFERLIRR
ncbi:MAG: DUF6455 family protein [Pseudomonadota bacterium]